MSAIKKAVKKIGKFVKKHWRKIVVAAAVVFTAGVAAGGLAAMKTAFATKGILGGIGATMKAGAAAIGRAIIPGGGGFSSAASGAATKAMGTAASTGIKAASTAAGKLASGTVAKAVTAGAIKGAGVTAAGTAAASAAPAAINTGLMKGIAPQASLGSAGTGGGVANAAATAAKPSFWNSMGGQALIQGGLSAASQYLAASAQEEQEPQGYWGVDLQGNRSLSPNELAFTDADITGGVQSFRPRLMYDDPQPQGG